jgi:hypothetical protein
MRRRSPDGPLVSIPGIDTVLSVLLPATQVGAPPARADSTARSFTAVHAAELILTLCEERSRCIQPLQFMPAHIAHRAGLIDLSTWDALVEKARADTHRNMRQFADALAHHRPHPRIPALLDAMTSPTAFRKIAFSIGLPDPFGDWIDHVHEKPVFAWSVSSLADQVARGHRPSRWNGSPDSCYASTAASSKPTDSGPGKRPLITTGSGMADGSGAADRGCDIQA